MLMARAPTPASDAFRNYSYYFINAEGRLSTTTGPTQGDEKEEEKKTKREEEVDDEEYLCLSVSS